MCLPKVLQEAYHNAHRMADNAFARCVIHMHDNKADMAYNKANQMVDYRQRRTGGGW